MGIRTVIAHIVAGPQAPPAPSPAERFHAAVRRRAAAQATFDLAPREAVDAAIAQLYAAETGVALALRDAQVAHGRAS